MTTSTRALVACAGLLAAFAAGRYSARQPDTIAHEAASETRQEAETVEAVQAVETSAATQEAQAATVAASSERVRIVYRERTPDGGERSLEVEAESARLVAELQASREEAGTLRAELAEARAAMRVETREVDRRVEVRTPLPDWRVGGLVGYDGGLAYGAEVQRRILGPVSVGAWGLSSGVLGVGVGVEIY